MKQTILQHKTIATVAAVMLGVIVLLVVTVSLSAKPKTVLAGTNRTVDFEDDRIQFHTAVDGIAVIRPTKPPNAAQAKISDPGEIWAQDTAHTYNNFTLPEAAKMDDESIGILTIDDIGLSVRVYESENQMEDMEKGVSHFKSTSAWAGNVGLSAHNITYSGKAQYFQYLYTLKKGAVIQYETALGIREYLVDSISEIAETDWSKLERSETGNQLTLVTCITGKPTMRLCVIAKENDG